MRVLHPDKGSIEVAPILQTHGSFDGTVLAVAPIVDAAVPPMSTNEHTCGIVPIVFSRIDNKPEKE